MALIPIVIYYNRTWDDKNKYSNFDVAGLLIPPYCKYSDLHGMVCSRLLWGPVYISTSIKFQIKPDISPISVSDDSGLRFYMEVSSNSSEQFKYPLIVDKLEINESLGDNTVLRTSLQDVTGSYSNQRELYVAPLDSREYLIRSNYSEQIAIDIMESEEERQKYITVADKSMDDIISEPNKYPVKVETSNVLLFTVYDIDIQFIVDMDQMSCTCNKFQYLDMPCAHAAAVIGRRNLSFYDYCSPLYKKTTLVATYSSSIKPMGDKENWRVTEDIKNIIVLPPNTRRPAERPKKGRFKHLYESRNQFRCGRCQEKGHNRRTCKNPVVKK